MYHRSLYYKGQSYVKYIKWFLYIVAYVPPYKGRSYGLPLQSNQPGTYPSHTHIHKINPYIVACIYTTIQGVNLMYSPSRAISQGHTQATPTYILTIIIIIIKSTLI